jgi:predicted Zn-dependent protease
LCALQVVGCASFGLPSPSTTDIQPDVAERKEVAARDFEEKRDAAQYQAALARFEQNDPVGCRSTLEQLLSRSPKHHGGRLLRAEIMLLDGDLAGTKQQLEELLTEKPDDAATHHLAGLLLEAHDDLGGAVEHYEHAVKQAPENPAFRTTLQVAQDALTTRKTGGGDGITKVSAQGTREFDAVAEDSPQQQTRLANATGRFAIEPKLKHAIQSGDAASVRRQVEALTAAMPLDPAVTIATATTLLAHNQSEQARKLLEAAKPHHPTSARLYQSLGLACYRLGDYQASYDALQTALSLDKSQGLSYFLMGCTLSKLGEQQAAEAQFARAAALDPRFAGQQ